MSYQQFSISFILFCLATLSINVRCSDVVTESLNDGWNFRLVGSRDWHPANVPSTVHLDLLDNKMIDDPYYRDNLLKLLWVETGDWEYHTDFTVTPEILAQDIVEMVFEGLDTHATVTLNGKLILQANNMHRTWVVDVKKHLLSKLNTIYVKFDSAAEHDIAAAQKLDPIVLPANYSHSRQASYQYGWDWGPRLVTAGIWQPISLRAYNLARIDSLLIRNNQVTKQTEKVAMHLTVDLEFASSGQYRVKLLNSDNGQVLVNSGITLLQFFFKRLAKTSKTFKFTIKNPQLWWTRQLGTPHLYQFQVLLQTRKGILVDSQNTTYGIRTVTWVQDQDQDFQQTGGVSFKANLNGIDVYMKGGNYIPPDMFMPRALKSVGTPNDVYNQTIQDAIDANYNMLRVWGGGQFEYDVFYDLCDKNGLLIWHDLMFACALYPGQQEMLDNIAAEMRDNVRRLRNHPSIAMWNGNNEVLIGWQEWGWQNLYTDKQKQTVYGWYQDIFDKTIPDVLKDQDPDRFYWPTSPSASYGNSPFQTGDIHYWGVWAGKSDIEDYNTYVGRFNSEYGMQGMIPMSSIKKFSVQADWNIDNIIMQLHERHPQGWPLLQHYMETYFQPPTSFEQYVYGTIVMQGYAVQIGIEALRRSQPYNMGSLYWQLNDVWPVFSWASVDFYGQWKMAQYRARDLYRDLMISIQADWGTTNASNTTTAANNFIVSIVNDYLDVVTGTLLVQLVGFDGTVECSDKRKISIASNSKSVAYVKFDSQTANSQLKTDVYVRAKIITDGTGGVSAQFVENTFIFTRPLKLNLLNPDIQFKVDVAKLEITFTTKNFAYAVYVYIDDDDQFKLDNNYFNLEADYPVTTKIIKGAVTSDLSTQIKILSLWNSYN